MPQITIGPEFFRNEARNYSQVGLCIAREAIQNSVDAKSTQISIQITPRGGDAELAVSDNGHGMSKSVLEGVFFCLGETTKGSNGTIGGYGKARVLLAFAQHSYVIRTGTVRCVGSGAEYQIEDGLPDVKGCRFTIQVACRELGLTPDALHRAFVDYLSLSQLSVSVTLNGAAHTDWTYRRQSVRTLSFGTAHVNKSAAAKNRLLVRVSGALMFSRSLISSPGQVIVEINPEKSREVLLSNRDSLKSTYAAELDAFCQEISTDTVSAFRDKNQAKTHILAGSARRFTAAQPHCSNSGTRDEINATDLVSVLSSIGFPNMPTSMPQATIRDQLLDGLIIVSKTTDPRLVRAARLFHPESWGDVHGNKRRKLLQQWMIACEAALASYCKITKVEGIAWRPGFVIDPEMLACHQEQSDGSHALLLNPVECREGQELGVGNILYKLRDYESHSRLAVLAAHEVTHCHTGCTHHGEAFSTMFTSIAADCAGRLPEIHRRMMAVA